jgi:4-hydroxy-3-methylbut-2-enyl diphosphate reductase
MGILGSAPKALIVENAQEARELFKDKQKYFKYTSNEELMKESEDENIVEKLYYPVIPKIGLVSQTTQSNDNVIAIARELASKARELRVYNTICNAMHEMQPSAVELSTRVDSMVVIGGRSSGNTRRLQELCSEQTDSHWIEDVSEMKEEWFTGKKHVGIAAGASTPDEDIAECVEWLKKFDERVNQAKSEVIIPAYVVH